MSVKFPQVQPPVGTNGIPYSGIVHPLAGSQPLQSTCPGSWMNPRCSRTRPVRCGWYRVGLLGQCLPSGYLSFYQALLLMLGSVVISAGYCLTSATTQLVPDIFTAMTKSAALNVSKPYCLNRRLLPSPIMLCPQVRSGVVLVS